MALSEVTLNDKIEVIQASTEYPVIQVRSSNIISRDDVEISRSFHRHVLTPDADLLGEDADVVAIANAVFTDEAKASYAEAKASTADDKPSYSEESK